MKHKTIDEFSEPKLELLQELAHNFGEVEASIPRGTRDKLLERGRQWGRGETPTPVDEAELGVSPSLLKYADKCARYAYRVFDREVDELKAEGVSEGEIVDATLTAALGVSLARLEKGLGLLEEL